MTRSTRRAVAVFAAALVPLGLASCSNGSDNTGSAASTPPAATATHGSAHQGDVEFTTMMIPHHEQAVVMSDMALARADVSPEVRKLATEIKAAQGPEIEKMTGWLSAWGEPAPTHDATDMAGHGDGMMTAEDMSALEATVEVLDVGEGAVDERVELLRQRFATNTEVEREAQEGDLLSISLLASQNGEPLPDATAEDVSYKLGDDDNMLEGLTEAVTGLKAGESKVFSTTLVGGSYRGQEADVEVTVGKVQEQELPEVDDEFAQLVSEFDTVEEMRDDLREAVEQQGEAEQLADARDKVLEAVVSAISFDLPEKLLSDEIVERRKQIENQLASAGLTVDQYLEQADDEQAETPEQFWESIDERSEQALRAQIVLDKYAEDLDVDVSQQELTELIFRKAQENRTTPQDEINHMMEHNHMGEWMQEIRRSKALQAMCAAVVVKDTAGNVIEMPEPEAEEEAAEESDDDSAVEIAESSTVEVEQEEEASDQE